MRIVAAALVALACLALSPARACLNDREKEAGKAEIPSDAPLPAVVVLPKEHWERKLAANAGRCANDRHAGACNSYAVALVRLGRSAEAIPLLEEVEKRSPGLYQTAVNLGTALELTGKDEAALRWITEGMRRNPESHAGTEWLHARILEAKIALKKDARWLDTHSPIDGAAEGPTGSAARPAWRAGGVTAPSGRALSQDDVSRALWYQLNERLQFVKAPEPMVGELLLELASLVALQHDGDKAMRLLKQAEEFKPVRAQLLAERKEHFESLPPAPGARKRAQAGVEPAQGTAWPYVLAVVAVLVAGGAWRRRLRQRQAQAK